MGNDQQPGFASLTPEQLEKLKQLEGELGDVYVLAYEQPPQPAHLDEEKLHALQEAERELEGVVLVAYRKPSHRETITADSPR